MGREFLLGEGCPHIGFEKGEKKARRNIDLEWTGEKKQNRVVNHSSLEPNGSKRGTEEWGVTPS